MADLVTRLFNPVDDITGQFQTVQQVLAGLRRIVGLPEETPEEKWSQQHVSVSRLHQNNNPVQVDDEAFSYREGEPVLGHVSPTIPQGTRVAIVGRTEPARRRCSTS